MFDEIEICYQHINIILSKMNEIYLYVSDESEISKIFKEKSLVSSIQKIQTAIQSLDPLPKVNIPAKVIENEQIQLINKTIIYFLKYLQFVKNQILKYKEIAISTAFKSNQLLTIRFCHFIVIFSKIVFFLSKFPTCLQIILSLYAANKESRDQDAQLMLTAIECTNNQDMFISISLRPVKFFIQKIMSELANMIIAFNNNYTFEHFSIFYCEPPKISTLPSLEYIIMMNYTVIQDMFKITFKIFDDLIDSNQVLARSVFSESNSIYLSSNLLYKFDDEFFYSIFFQSEFSENILEQILDDLQKSNIQKIKYVLFLLNDYLNFAQFSFDYVMDNYVKLISLTNYAIYEIASHFTYHTLKSNKSDVAISQVTNSEFNYVLELLTTITDLIDLMNSKDDDIKRYYLFNLATNDLQFLIEGMKGFQLIDSQSNELLPIIDLEQYNLNEKSRFLPILYNELLRMSESLKIIDIEKYDSGEKYSFLPFNINAGRLLCYFSKNKQNSTCGFVNCVLEHLNTILLHISFVENSYSSYCNFSFLSNYAKSIVSERCKIGEDLSINNYGSLLRILEYLQYDKTISNEAKQTVVEQANFLINFTLTRVQSHCQSILSNTSPYMNTSYTSTPILATTFSSKAANGASKGPLVRIYDQNLSNDKKEKQTAFIKNNFEIYDLFNRVLKTKKKENQISISDTLVSQFIKQLPIYAYHSMKQSRNSESQILSASDIKKANYALIEYFWPCFTIFNIPFKRVMYNSRLNQVMIPYDCNFLRQFNKFDGNVGLLKSVDQKLFTQYSNYLEDFLDKKMYQTILYQTANNGFFPSQCLSSAALRDIIDDFGPYLVFNLDIVLVNHISNSIINIYQNFLDNSSDVIAFLQKFKETSELPNLSEIEKILPICDEIIKLGAVVVIRRLLRSQSALSCEENLPGFMNVIAQGLKSSLDVLSVGSEGVVRLRSEERMLVELFGGSGGGSRNLFLAVDDEFAFVRPIIQKKNLQQHSNFSAFCFYMSLMLLDDQFNNIKCHPNIDAIDRNAHLFPMAMGAIIDCANVLFSCFDGNSVKYGLKEFFLAFSSVYTLRSQTPNSSETLDALIYLATLFPKYIRPLEYERIEEAFPLIEMTQILAENKNNQNPLA